MSQSCVGETSNSFNTNNNSFNTVKTPPNNNNSFNTVNNFGNGDERAEILSWLSPLEPWVRHQDIRAHRVEDVGDWLLQTEEYRNWFDGNHGEGSNNSTLFCYGNPGVGKTYTR